MSTPLPIIHCLRCGECHDRALCPPAHASPIVCGEAHAAAARGAVAEHMQTSENSVAAAYLLLAPDDDRYRLLTAVLNDHLHGSERSLQLVRQACLVILDKQDKQTRARLRLVGR